VEASRPLAGCELAGHRRAAALVAGSHEEFITEHYYGYCAQRDGGAIEYRVEHPPWNVWQAARSNLDAKLPPYTARNSQIVFPARPTPRFWPTGRK